MLLESPSMLFPLEKCDPEEISWQLSLGHTALDKVANPEFAGMTAVECCLAMIGRRHRQESDSGRPDPDEEKSLRLLVEDAVGDPSFQTDLLPRLVHEAIEAENMAVVEILLSYSTDQGLALKIANAHPGEVVDPGAGRREARGHVVVNEGDDHPEGDAPEAPGAPGASGAEGTAVQAVAGPQGAAGGGAPAEGGESVDPALTVPSPCPRL